MTEFHSTILFLIIFAFKIHLCILFTKWYQENTLQITKNK